MTDQEKEGCLIAGCFGTVMILLIGFCSGLLALLWALAVLAWKHI